MYLNCWETLRWAWEAQITIFRLQKWTNWQVYVSYRKCNGQKAIFIWLSLMVGNVNLTVKACVSAWAFISIDINDNCVCTILLHFSDTIKEKITIYWISSCVTWMFALQWFAYWNAQCQQEAWRYWMHICGLWQNEHVETKFVNLLRICELNKLTFIIAQR